MVGLGGLAYIVHYISNLSLLTNSTTGSVPSPLDLAATSGTIGGLLLIGAFAKADNPQYNKLKRIGKFFLGAAAFFTIAFLLLEWARITNPPHLNLWQQINDMGQCYRNSSCDCKPCRRSCRTCFNFTELVSAHKERLQALSWLYLPCAPLLDYPSAGLHPDSNRLNICQFCATPISRIT